MSIAVFLII